MGLSSALSGAVGVLPAGAVIPYAGSAAPAGWLLCGGQAVSRSDYAALFAIIGTTYGVGNGSTTFNLPDLRGRVVAGEDDMGGTAANRLTSGNSGIAGTTLGASGGAETVTLTSAQSGVPAHSHANTLTNNAVTSGNDNTDHTHSGTTGADSPDHSHGVPIGVAQEGVFSGIIGTSGHNGNVHPWTASAGSGGRNTTHNHNFGTGGRSAFHQHSVTSNVTISNVNNTATNASSAHTNTQPTIILNYIIKAVAY